MTLWQWDSIFEWENDKNSSLVMEIKEEGWVKEDERFLGGKNEGTDIVSDVGKKHKCLSGTLSL